MLGQNAAYASQQQAQADQRQQQQLPTPQPLSPDELAAKNTGTEEQEACLQEFLAEHPHGSPWDESNHYKNWIACAAFAFQAQDTVFGEISDYVKTDRLEDIRQYSVVVYKPFSGPSHAVFVTQVNENGTFRIAEGNVNGKVSIGLDAWWYWEAQIIGVWNPA